jgi:uncharacterized protein (DUF1778 family)
MRDLTDTAKCRIELGMKDPPQTTARLEARLPTGVMARLKRAAEIKGRTLTDFVVAAADEAACRAIEETEIIRVSLEGQRQIAEAILNPPHRRPPSSEPPSATVNSTAWNDGRAVSV